MEQPAATDTLREFLLLRFAECSLTPVDEPAEDDQPDSAMPSDAEPVESVWSGLPLQVLSCVQRHLPIRLALCLGVVNHSWHGSTQETHQDRGVHVFILPCYDPKLNPLAETTLFTKICTPGSSAATGAWSCKAPSVAAELPGVKIGRAGFDLEMVVLPSRRWLCCRPGGCQVLFSNDRACDSRCPFRLEISDDGMLRLVAAPFKPPQYVLKPLRLPLDQFTRLRLTRLLDGRFQVYFNNVLKAESVATVDGEQLPKLDLLSPPGMFGRRCLRVGSRFSAYGDDESDRFDGRITNGTLIIHSE